MIIHVAIYIPRTTEEQVKEDYFLGLQREYL